MVAKNNLTKVEFTTCYYQSEVPLGKRTCKPQMFAGSLLGIKTLAGECPCGRDTVHVPIIGKKRSLESGRYPDDLCKAYAALVIQHFKRMATLEFYVQRAAGLAKEVEEIRTKGIKRKE